MTIEFLVRRLIAFVIVFLLTWGSMVAAVHAAENPRKMTVVSFGLFGDQGVFRREATSAAQIAANRFGGDPVIVKYNTKTGGSATVETLATTLQAEAKKMNGESGAVAGLVGIECGVVSGVINLESSGVEASDWRPRHDEHYHEA